MSAEEGKNKACNWNAKIVLTIILFIAFLVYGLIAVESNFNSLIGKDSEVKVFKLEEESKNVYKLEFFGMSREMDIQSFKSLADYKVRTVMHWIVYAKEKAIDFLD